MPGTKIISAVKARVHLGEIMRQAFKQGARFIVEKSGIPTVAIINATEYRRLVEEKEERFNIIDQIRAKLPDLSEKSIEKDVSQAIKAVRKQNA
jgi:prevent-host-death family protein